MLGTNAFVANGETTFNWASGSWTYGAGGGAGGSIWLIAQDLWLGGDSIQANGGLGERYHIRHGGDGGDGRIRLDYVTINGYDYGTTSATTQANSVSSPVVGGSLLPQ